MLNIFNEFNWRELLDIGLVAFIYYHLIMLVRGTRAVAVLYGLVVILALYFLSGELGLYTLNWLLANFLSSIFLVVVILFQKDVRKGLARMGAGWGFRRKGVGEDLINELALGVASMSRSKTGALIVLERNIPLGDIIEQGVEVDGQVTREMLKTIFFTDTPLHDGAVVIRKGRLAAAGCILPLSTNVKRHTEFGTRHRAALGISESSDAVAVVVSEERGDISVAIGGRLTTSLDEVRLKRVLMNTLSR